MELFTHLHTKYQQNTRGDGAERQKKRAPVRAHIQDETYKNIYIFISKYIRIRMSWMSDAKERQHDKRATIFLCASVVIVIQIMLCALTVRSSTHKLYRNIPPWIGVPLAPRASRTQFVSWACCERASERIFQISWLNENYENQQANKQTGFIEFAYIENKKQKILHTACIY